MKPSKLVVIAAPSGTGKTTLCEKLLNDFPELKLSISSTTRKPRGKEVHGKEYFFLTEEEFKSGIQNNTFIEWAEVHGNYYGTSLSTVMNTMKSGHSVLLDIDVEGARSLLKSFPDQCVLIFILPPSMEELERRLRARGTETEESIQKRMKNATDEMAQASFFTHKIVNDTIEKAYFQIQGIVAHELRGITHA